MRVLDNFINEKYKNMDSETAEANILKSIK